MSDDTNSIENFNRQSRWFDFDPRTRREWDEYEDGFEFDPAKVAAQKAEEVGPQSNGEVVRSIYDAPPGTRFVLGVRVSHRSQKAHMDPQMMAVFREAKKRGHVIVRVRRFVGSAHVKNPKWQEWLEEMYRDAVVCRASWLAESVSRYVRHPDADRSRQSLQPRPCDRQRLADIAAGVTVEEKAAESIKARRALGDRIPEFPAVQVYSVVDPDAEYTTEKAHHDGRGDVRPDRDDWPMLIDDVRPYYHHETDIARAIGRWHKKDKKKNAAHRKWVNRWCRYMADVTGDIVRQRWLRERCGVIGGDTGDDD